jgi:hypothetical protein
MTCSRKIRPEIGVSSIWVQGELGPQDRQVVAVASGPIGRGERMRGVWLRFAVDRAEGDSTQIEKSPTREIRSAMMADFDVRGEHQDADVGQLLVITRAVSSPSVVLVGGIRMSTTTSSGLFSRARETRSVTASTCNPGERISSWQVCRFCGWRQAAMGVSGDDICSPQRKSVNHGPRQRRVRLAGLARRRVASSRRRPQRGVRAAALQPERHEHVPFDRLRITGAHHPDRADR